METPNNSNMNMISLRELIASEDKRYEQRFSALDKTIDSEVKTQKTAMETALVAQKTAMETAFIAAEKVSGKTEHATSERFKSIDGTLEQTRQQAMTFIPRQEWQITVDNLASAIKKLEEFQAQNVGAESYSAKSKTQSNWSIGIVISSIAIAISIITILIKVL